MATLIWEEIGPFFKKSDLSYENSYLGQHSLVKQKTGFSVIFMKLSELSASNVC